MILDWFPWDKGGKYPKIHPTQKPVKCEYIGCSKCLRYRTIDCDTDKLQKWANSEYREPVYCTYVKTI